MFRCFKRQYSRFQIKLLYWVHFLLSAFICITSTSGPSPIHCKESTKRSDLNSYLWRIERSPPSYFFGTIHVPYTQVWDYIPTNSKQAFQNSNNIFLELDLADHDTATALALCQLLPDNQTVDQVLPHKLYKRLRRHMTHLKRKLTEWIRPSTGETAATEQGMLSENYIEYQFRAMTGSWERLRPIWLMLTVNSLTESDVKTFGVPVLDLYLSRQAVRLGKRTGAVESVLEQCEPLNRLNHTKVVQALDEAVRRHRIHRKEGGAPRNELLVQYNCGDLQKTLFEISSKNQIDMIDSESSLTGGISLDKYFEIELLSKRNSVMTERIANLLNQYPDESFFFAFGAGHFLGNSSVVDQLRDKGFSISHIPAGEKIRQNRLQSRKVYVNDGVSDDTQRESNVIRHRGDNNKKASHRNSKEKSSNPYPNFTKLWIKIEETMVGEPAVKKTTTLSTLAPVTQHMNSAALHIFRDNILLMIVCAVLAGHLTSMLTH